MQKTLEHNRMRLHDGAAILMARLVDRTGASVPPYQVAAIEYSIFRIESARSNRIAPVAGHIAVPLDVDDVMYDSLQIGGAWDIDAGGYNFRHLIEIGEHAPFPAAGALYAIRYGLTSLFRDKTILQFQVRH